MQNLENSSQLSPFESTDIPKLRQLDRDDHLSIHESEILQKLQEYRQSMQDFEGFSPEVKLATIQCLVALDQKYGLKEVCTSLQELIPVVTEHAFHFHKKDEDRQGEALYKIRLLISLFNELDWIRVHGCGTLSHKI